MGTSTYEPSIRDLFCCKPKTAYDVRISDWSSDVDSSDLPDLEIQHFHHAGNSSGVVDGAAALLLTSKDYADKHGLKPRGRVVAYANIGDDPTLMLNAPVQIGRAHV